MKFFHVNCIVCGDYIFNSDEIVAFRRDSKREFTPVELHGEQPWCGMFCICRKCIQAISKVQDAIKTN